MPACCLFHKEEGVQRGSREGETEQREEAMCTRGWGRPVPGDEWV